MLRDSVTLFDTQGIPRYDITLLLSSPHLGFIIVLLGDLFVSCHDLFMGLKS